MTHVEIEQISNEIEKLWDQTQNFTVYQCVKVALTDYFIRHNSGQALPPPPPKSAYRKVHLDLNHGLDLRGNDFIPGTTNRYGQTSEKCFHAWEEYVGLTQRYNYCTNCNEKQATKSLYE
jgi:hypothetical protein